jgi:excisionase family DNA binding protein
MTGHCDDYIRRTRAEQTGPRGKVKTMNDRLMLRPGEAAEAIGVSRSKAYELIARGDIPSVRVGGCVRVPVDALRAWIGRQLEDRATAT